MVALLTVASTLIYYSFFKVVQVQQTAYFFSVEDGKIGLVGDQDAVKFGDISPGGTGTRSIFFKNDFEFPVKVKINVEGEKDEWIKVKENNFVLKPNTNKTTDITVFIPKATPEHINYTGKVYAYYLKV